MVHNAVSSCGRISEQCTLQHYLCWRQLSHVRMDPDYDPIAARAITAFQKVLSKKPIVRLIENIYNAENL